MATHHGSDEGEKDLEIFEAIGDVLKCLQKLKNLLRSKPEWYHAFCPSYTISLQYDPSQALDDANALERAQAVRRLLKPAYGAVTEVSKWITIQYFTCEQQISFLKLRSGFTALPDEILSVVLEYAAFQQHEHDEHKAITRTVSAATRLSHVCSRFRRLVISSPYLWDRVCPRMRPSAVAACFARCGRNAEVHFATFQYTNKELRVFTPVIIPNSKVWRRLVVDCGITGLARYTEEITQLEELSKPNRYLNVPFVTDLRISYPERALSTQYAGHEDQRQIHFYSKWKFVRLQSLAVANLIPLPFSGSTSLRSLSISLSLGWYGPDPGHLDVRAFAAFLASCSALENVFVSLKDCRRSIPFTPNNPLEMTNVTNLHLRLDNCNHIAINDFQSAIYFPSVSSMRVEIRSNQYGEGGVVENTADNVLHSVFPNAQAFPNLRELRLKIDAEDSYTKSLRQHVSIPFIALPGLKHLQLTTRMVTPVPPADATQLPPLRSLALSDCIALEPYQIADFLRGFQMSPSTVNPLHFTIDGVERREMLRHTKRARE